MRGGIVLLLVGLFIGWLAVTGKYCCLSQLWNCASSEAANPCSCGATDKPSEPQSLEENLLELLKPLDIPGISIYPYAELPQQQRRA